MASTKINIVFGAMTVGKAGLDGCHQTTTTQIKEVFDTLQRHGHSDIDTSRAYGAGTSEALLGDSKWQERDLQIHTKIYPTANWGAGPDTFTLGAADLRRALTQSLDALKTDCVDLWYLHAPDRNTPLEVTMQEVDKLHREGKFKRLGISNFMSWEVSQLCELCDRHGWIRPSVYQGIYNPLHRAIEAELIPCLRHYNIALYAFQPLAGGLLTGRYSLETTTFASGTRFDPNNRQSSAMNDRYWNQTTFAALDIIQRAAGKHNLTVAECAMRWLAHHSVLNRQHGDSLLIGASSVKQLENNLTDLDKGPLPEDVVQAMEQAWSLIQEPVRKYWH
ncbi:NADP-dependent oxidoreductase domain-containing protein [Aspergillus coremiiformis]|uniref:D-xylose reductase [NAD(P)H] n=1 Tax=Aspergillus coremiiformis TaxID=138285 RepID=A0A5N6ZG03_9EURO|nr:NADP-dependent oxidoreductase domain-containing protein [Aspergillus coremiiformis]